MTIAERLKEKLELGSQTLTDDEYYNRQILAEREVYARLAPILARLVEVTEKANEIIWLNKCTCDAAYTSRGMHEPNAIHREFDDLASALSALAKELGE